MKEIIKVLLPIKNLDKGFTSCYLVLFLIIPFLNILIKAMSQKQHLALITIFVSVYVVWASIGFNVVFNYITWFCILYFVASYNRLYPNNILNDKNLWIIISIGVLLLSWLSIIVLSKFALKTGRPLSFSYYFVSDSNKILAFVTGLSVFQCFKNLKIGNIKFINIISSATFGVLLIHANSDVMRQWLWRDTLRNVDFYGTKAMLPHAVISVMGVFAVCMVIDLLRIKFIETPFLRFYDKKIDGNLKKFFNRIWSALTKSSKAL